jgi:P4 family phage/plasmid primase-like protien
MSAAEHPLGALAPLAAYPQFIVAMRATKVPLHPVTATPHNAHDPAIWMPYEQAASIVATWGAEVFGVGFVLTERDPFAVIDIDGALQADGTWSPLSIELCQALPGAVVEVSQSGRGLHVWLRSRAMPPHAKKNTAEHIESYSADRYVMLGTNPSPGPMLDDCPGIHGVVARWFPPRADTAADVSDDGPCAEWSGPTDDAALLEIAMRSRSASSVFGDGVAFSDLWTGNADALGRKWPGDGRPYDASSADMALATRLAFFTGRDAGRIDRMMRGSALVRDKFDRPDYLPRTIAAACAQVREVYRGGTREPVAADAPPSGAAASDMPTHDRFAILACDSLNTAKALIVRRFAHADGARLRSWQGSCYRWDAAHWREMEDPDMRAVLYDFLDRDGGLDYRPSQSKVSNLFDAVKHAAGVHLDSALTPPCWIFGEPTAAPTDLVACANGLLHLPTRTMLPATPRFFNLNAVPYEYDPHAAPPTQWLQFLNTVWPDDPEAIAALQELFGYMLTPNTSQQKIFLIVGPKRSGKGTIARVLTEMLGADNVTGPTLASMGGPFGLQSLIGSLAAIVSDARLGGKTDSALVAENLLRISGEDRIEVARKNLPSRTLRLGTRFVLLTNELPRINDASGAMASRFVILTMTQSFFGREDPGLTARLLRELPGVLLWAVEGWHRLQARGHFIEPKSSAGAAQELADLGSPIGAFVRDECQCSPVAEVEVGELFSKWRDWCVRQGMTHAGTVQTFGRDLRAAFPSIVQAQPRIDGARLRVYRGIKLRGTHWHAHNPIAAHTPHVAR